MTKHQLQIVLGLVRKANNEGRLYPVPREPECDERRCLNFLVRYGALVAQLGTTTSAEGYMAVKRTVGDDVGDGCERAHVNPMRKASAYVS
jgi:hypothetical protein